VKETIPGYPEDAFDRLDETDDAIFYARERLVSHVDSLAAATIEQQIGRLVIEDEPVILDLMASWDSHLPPSVAPSSVVGLGLNESELLENSLLTKYVVHDLNKAPTLPLADETFDVVLCTLSVDYLTSPVRVFREVGRILPPGGLFLVTFSNRFFPEKAVRLWRESADDERLRLVIDFFAKSGAFERPGVFVSRGKPRPSDDKYADLGIPSDPVYAVYADKRGGCRTVRGTFGREPVQPGRGRPEETTGQAHPALSILRREAYEMGSARFAFHRVAQRIILRVLQRRVRLLRSRLGVHVCLG
jgi:SAM-dependent methyltransferase